MALRNMTLSDVDRLGLDADADRTALTMDEDAFRGFYDRTARALWAYLARATGDSAAADDLLQECYYRLLRARSGVRRRGPPAPLSVPGGDEPGTRPSPPALTRTGLSRGIRGRRRRLRRRPWWTRSTRSATSAARSARSGRATATLLWFAYAQGLTHVEIAESMGVKPTSVQMLLFRARTRLAAILGRTHGGRA